MASTEWLNDQATARLRGATKAPDGTVTLMFTDLVDSTAILQRLGDTEAARNRTWLADYLDPHARLVRDCVGEHNGFEVTTTGDGFLLAFADPADALACAVTIQQRMAAAPVPTPLPGNPALQARIGIHTGTPSRQDTSDASQFLGDSVHFASRVAAAAGGGQVFLSEQTHVLVKRQFPQLQFHAHGEIDLKGIGPEPMFEVLWEGKQPTPPRAQATMPDRSDQRPLDSRAAGGEHRTVTAGDGSVAVGRDVHGSVIVNRRE